MAEQTRLVSQTAALHKSANADLYSRYDQFIRRAVETFGSAAVAREWLDTPQDYFSGKTPLSFAQEQNFEPDVYEPFFIRLSHGIYE